VTGRILGRFLDMGCHGQRSGRSIAARMPWGGSMS
jgi:hypothetical protein